MSNSTEWYSYFTQNSKNQRINWNQPPLISSNERRTILSSLQAWQLGETSDGRNLIYATRKYAATIDDPFYIDTMEFFIREEQKHGNQLGLYLDRIGESRIKHNWGDSLFRKIRHFNTSMEIWTLAVITVESAAQLFYQSLKRATHCPLLQEICTDILVDEAAHIQFQMDRMQVFFQRKKAFARKWYYCCYLLFFQCTSWVIWLTHRKVFRAGKNGFMAYHLKMMRKFEKTLGSLQTVTIAGLA